MNPPPADTPETVTVSATINLAGGRLELEMAVPAGPTRPIRMLPLFQSLADSFVAVAEHHAKADGLTVSCQKGCGACCRQLVPIREIEAHHIREVVDALPEPRKAEVLARFAAARKRLEEAGLIEILLAPEQAEPAALERLVHDYFRLGIACPFLEDESCSIHTQRPVACREYLVVSPPEHCARLSAEGIRRLNIRDKVSKGLRVFDADHGAQANRWVPLVLAVDWADTHPDASPTGTGPELLGAVFNRLAGEQGAALPDAPPAGAVTSSPP